ncbi:hypothetical protein [Deinococcus sp.]|uniref:hypothetical protein n=1 Tax=Deinococcus sp. TaxID=47478 RepID=UPI003CC5B8FA
MSDIKNALAQLRAARTGSDGQTTEQPAEQPAPSDPVGPTPLTPITSEAEREAPLTDLSQNDTPSRTEVKTLAGRVPLALHRELTRALLDASEQLRVSKINVDEALEAAIRLVLRDAEVTARWYAELKEVRRERRQG